MTTVRLALPITADAQTAWSVISDLSRLAAFDPELASVQLLRGEGAEAVLCMVNHAGLAWEERCVAYESGRSLQLAAVGDSLPFPFRARGRKIALHAQGEQLDVVYEVTYATRAWPLGALKVSRRRQQSLVQQTLEGMVHAVRDDQWRHTITVQSILNRKGNKVVCVRPGDPIEEVVQLIKANRIGAVLVLDDAEKLVGLVSERDVAMGLADEGGALLAQPVSTIMSTNLVVCAPDHDMEFVMVCMTDKRIRHLPVLDGGKLVGIVSIGDVVLQRIAALEAQSQTMREYIEAREWRYLNAAGGDADQPSQGSTSFFASND